MTGLPAGDAGGSARTAAARARAAERLARRRDAFRPLAGAVIAIVVAGAFGAHPRPGASGRGLAVSVALVVFAAGLASAARATFLEAALRRRLITVVALIAAGIVLAAIQRHGATELAESAAVFTAISRLPRAPGIGLALVGVAGVALGVALSGDAASAVFASALLCVLLALLAHALRETREAEDRAELLMAELEDAREARDRAVAVAERTRIAGELHDVLAHSLSGAAIQLEAARLLADRSGEPEMEGAVARAVALVREGLTHAREAVGALRGERPLGPGDLDELVDRVRRDLGVDARLRVEGAPRELPPDPAAAIYRAAQEALTNVARHAPGAATEVVLSYEAARIALRIENGRPQAAAASGPVAAGGGNGLASMRERAERAGGRAHAGPTADGWLVELEVPA